MWNDVFLTSWMSEEALVVCSSFKWHGDVSLQHKQFWKRSWSKEGSFDRAAVVVQRLEILVAHIETRVKLGMWVKQSFSMVESEVQKSRLRVCIWMNFPAMLSFWISVDFMFKTWQCRPVSKRSLEMFKSGIKILL